MNKKHLEILTNIIGGVESGGQIYGKRRYEAYAGKKANSPNENTCTLGWAQNYGNRGRKLCQMILDADPAAFRKADTAGIEKKLQADWEATGWSPNAKEKAALIAIITTDAGKKCQDALFAELAERYIKEAESYGVEDIQAQMMWCEIEHLGGAGPVKRIFSRAAKPYTPDSIFASLLLDQRDTSNSNQVGDKIYQSRHECCVKWIKQYVAAGNTDKGEAKVTEKQVRQKVLAIMQGWVNLSRSAGTHKVIIDTYNGFKPLPRGYAVTYKDAYCATTVSAAGIKAGMTDIIPRECGCGEMVKLFQRMGRWKEQDDYVPDIADIIYYDWGDSGKGDNTGEPDHVGMIESVSGGIMTVIEGNMNGGVVGRRKIAVNARYIRGFGVPDYASKATAAAEPESEKEESGSSSDAPNRTPKWVGKVTASSLNVRTWAGTEYPNIKSWPTLAEGNLVDVCDTIKASDGDKWYFVRIAGKIYGFVHSAHIERV